MEAYIYRIEGHYVIQYRRSTGERIGYLCSVDAWERVFYALGTLECGK